MRASAKRRYAGRARTPEIDRGALEVCLAASKDFKPFQNPRPRQLKSARVGDVRKRRLVIQDRIVPRGRRDRCAARIAKLKIRLARSSAVIAERHSRIFVRNAERIIQRANASVESAARRSERPRRLHQQRNRMIHRFEQPKLPLLKISKVSARRSQRCSRTSRDRPNWSKTSTPKKRAQLSIRH